MSDGYCQVCNRELPHPPYDALAASGTGDCIGAIIEALASPPPPYSTDQESGSECAFCGYDAYYDNRVDRSDESYFDKAMSRPELHEPGCLWRRAVEAMKP